jgi:YhcH/YjgK/YiaL family protein
MALFGDLNYIKKYIKLDNNQYNIVSSYIERIFNEDSEEYKRLSCLSVGSFEKVVLSNDIFALEQVYFSKTRKKSFFESHRKYIDIQVILKGEEIIEIKNIKDMKIKKEYNPETDLIIYEDEKEASKLILKAGDVAVFYPEDAHMPGLKLSNSVKVIKTVVKVQI